MNLIETRNEYGSDIFCHIDYGLCRLTINKKCPNVLWLSTFVVDEMHRFQGIGSRLLQKVIELAKTDGFTIISLQVESTSWMEKWYERNGFVKVADGYDDNMVIMSKYVY